MENDTDPSSGLKREFWRCEVGDARISVVGNRILKLNHIPTRGYLHAKYPASLENTS